MISKRRTHKGFTGFLQGFLISQNSSENTCARVSFHLSYRLESCNPIKKGLQHMCCGFAKFLSTSFLQNTSRRLLLNFFINFTGVFFATHWINWKQFLYIFKHVLPRLLNVNLNDLVVAAWEHTFLGDITWNLAVFIHWLSIYMLYVIYLLNLCTPQLCSYSTEHQIKSKMKLEKAVALRCSVKKVFPNLY